VCASALTAPPAPHTPLFPYTTLFRSRPEGDAHRTVSAAHEPRRATAAAQRPQGRHEPRRPPARADRARRALSPRARVSAHRETRSEEHTSELQSRSDLVCRLRLEKKK